MAGKPEPSRWHNVLRRSHEKRDLSIYKIMGYFRYRIKGGLRLALLEPMVLWFVMTLCRIPAA